MRLLAFVHEYALTRDLTPDSIRQLQSAVRALDRSLGRQVHVRELCTRLVNDFLAQQKAAGLSWHTRRNRRRILLTLWKAAAFAGLVAPRGIQPVAPVRSRGHLVHCWTVAQVRQLLAAAEGLQGHVGRRLPVPRAAYWASYVAAAWDSGLRGCDVRCFRRDLIAPDGTVRLVQNKTDRRQRVRLHPSTLERIDRCLAVYPRLVIWPVASNLRVWRKAAARVVRAAGLTGSLGRLRHSSGTDVELRFPGQGHYHLGNSRAVFEAHYFDDSRAVFTRPMPQPLDEVQ